MIAKHRKVHLFDIDVKGGQRFKESDTLSAGNSMTSFVANLSKVEVSAAFLIPRISGRQPTGRPTLGLVSRPNPEVD